MSGCYSRKTVNVLKLFCCAGLIVEMGMGWIEASYADQYEYAIELHSSLGERHIGETDLEIIKNSHTINPVTKKKFEGVLYSFKSHFRQTAGIRYEWISQDPILADFFQANFIDHVWQRLGSGDLQLDEYYYERTVEVLYPKRHTSMRPFCCGFYRQGETVVQLESKSTAQVIMQHIFKSSSIVSGTESTLQEWIVNEMEAGTEGEGGFTSFDGYLRQNAPYDSVTTLSEIKPFKRQKWRNNRTILTPFSHTYTGLDKVKQLPNRASRDFGTYRKFLLPMDWKRAAESKGADTGVSIKVQGDLLQLYERRETGILIKQDKANLYQRYDFEPQEGYLDLSIWAVPGSFVPVAWEYREITPQARAIRYVRVLPNDEKSSVISIDGQELQVTFSDVVKPKPPGHITRQPLPVIPEQHPSSTTYNTVGETRLSALPAFLLLIVPAYGKRGFMNPIHTMGVPSVLSY